MKKGEERSLWITREREIHGAPILIVSKKAVIGIFVCRDKTAFT